MAVAVGSWNAGNAAVLVGTLAEMTFLADVGAAVGLLLARIGPTSARIAGVGSRADEAVPP